VIQTEDTLEKEEPVEALTEIEMLADLDCPYIVGYFDSWIVEQQINIVMEFC
jgi:hypothetical protein